MKETKLTTEGVDIRGRRSGNTTRQVDAAIDYLFSGYKVKVRDHHTFGANNKDDKVLFRKIIARLTYEHNLNLMLTAQSILIDEKNLTIELV